jgi:two-component system OmpR family response regulator
LRQAEGSGYDAVILDSILPDAAGLVVIERLRAAGVASPTLMLAAHATVSDRLQGLDAGADDYLTAPFTFDELTARLRAITRRGEQPVPDDRLTVGDLVLDRRTRVVTRGSGRLNLAPKEFALLEYLMRHPGQVVTRAVLLEHVWDYGFDPRANVVDAAIKRLRRSVDAGAAHPLIRTVRGVGYKIQNEA